MLTADQIKHLGQVAAWLEAAPEAKLSYGDFYVGEVVVKFDGDPSGRFIFHDGTWNYYDQEEVIPPLLTESL